MSNRLLIIATAVTALTLTLGTLLGFSGAVDDPKFGTKVDFAASITSTIALLWVVINAFAQQHQLNQHQREIEIQARALQQTADSTYSQFYVMFYDEYERALDRIAERIGITLNIPGTETALSVTPGRNDCFVRHLAECENLSRLAEEALESDNTGIARSELQRFVDAHEMLSKLPDNQETSKATSSMLEIFITANPSAMLAHLFQELLNKK